MMAPPTDLQAKHRQLSTLAAQWREWPFELPEGLDELENVNEMLAIAIVVGRAIGCPKQAIAWVGNMSPWLQSWVKRELSPAMASVIDLSEQRRDGLLVRATAGARL